MITGSDRWMVRVVSSTLGQIVTRDTRLSISAERKRTTTASAGVASGRGAFRRVRTRCADQATFATSTGSSASSRPRPAAMVLTACKTLAAAAVSTVGSALDQPAT